MIKQKIMIVDDHSIVREGLKMIFETQDTYEICGEAANGEEALTLLKQLDPDLILLDMKMPQMDGITFLRQFVKQEITIPVVVLTTLKDMNLIQEAMALGAKGYLLKDAKREQLFATVKEALNGSILLQSEIGQLLFSSQNPNNIKGKVQDYGLTEREIMILKEVAQGDTSRKIALNMGISERTVKAHLTNIYVKMGVASRSEAVALALANHVIHM